MSRSRDRIGYPRTCPCGLVLHVLTVYCPSCGRYTDPHASSEAEECTGKSVNGRCLDCDAPQAVSFTPHAPVRLPLPVWRIAGLLGSADRDAARCALELVRVRETIRAVLAGDAPLESLRAELPAGSRAASTPVPTTGAPSSATLVR